MNEISAIFRRADIRQIRSFLLYGTEEVHTDPRPYAERIESACWAVSDRLRADYPDEEALEAVLQPIYGYASAVEEVYMEIGLQAGAMLAAQAAGNWKAALEGE